MLLSIVNDGDFRAAEINECTLLISYFVGNRKTEKSYDLRLSKENIDLFTEEIRYFDNNEF